MTEIQEGKTKFKPAYRPRKGELAINGKLVVLVTGYGNQNAGYRCFSGVVVSPDNENDFAVGFYSRTWGNDAFKKLDMKITFLPVINNQNK